MKQLPEIESLRTLIGPGSDPAFAAEALNSIMEKLDAEQRLSLAYDLFGKDHLIATTSFGRDAALLLHHLHRLNAEIPIFFIETGFHFLETLAYRDALTKAWNLNIRTMESQEPDRRRYALSTPEGLTISDTDACCGLNKVVVQRAFLGDPSVYAFISGLRRDQSETRQNMPFALVQRGKIKLCPFADWPQADVDMYFKLWETPEHPLASQGYTSIGCSPITCTRKPIAGADARSGRWADLQKVECGLHLDLDP